MKQHHGISFVYPFHSDGLSHTYLYNRYGIVHFICFFFFVALRPMSTAMVIAGRSVHLTTLFPGQA